MVCVVVSRAEQETMIKAEPVKGKPLINITREHFKAKPVSTYYKRIQRHCLIICTIVTGSQRNE